MSSLFKNCIYQVSTQHNKKAFCYLINFDYYQTKVDCM